MQQLLAFLDELLAVVIRKYADVSIGACETEAVSQPLVGVVSGHDAGLPDPVKPSVRLNALVSQLRPGQCAQGLQRSLVDTNIGVAHRITGANIQKFCRYIFAMYQ